MAVASYTANAETSSFTRTHKTAKNTSYDLLRFQYYYGNSWENA